MIYDSYKNFLPDSWFTKTFDHLFIEWINFLSGYVVSFCIVSHVVSKLLFSTRIMLILDHCFSVSSFVLSRWGVFCNWTLSTQCHWRNKRTVSPECVPGHAPLQKNLKIGRSGAPCPAFPGSNAINSYVYFHLYFVEFFSESGYSWFLSRSTKIHHFLQVLTITIHDSWSRFHPRCTC